MFKKPKNFMYGGRGRQNTSRDRSYYSHDNRTGPSNEGPNPKFANNKPRVSFKRQSNKSNWLADKSRNYLIKQELDDDVSMSAGSNSTRQVVQRGRGKFFQRGRNSPIPRAGVRDNRNTVPETDLNCYRITILHGHKYTKEFIIGNLNSYLSPITFTPIRYKVSGNDAVFYVDDHKTATKLADCDRRITTNDGHKMIIKVRPGLPPLDITDALKEKLKLAMAKRYRQETNALDLSKFYHDSDLSEDYWCPLAQTEMLMAVLDIIHENVPNLEALNLDSNKLQNIDKLSILAEKFVKLRILYIGDNKIKDIYYVNALKNLQLEELRLEGNPLCIKYKSKQDEYVSDVKQMFPKLLKLDGVELPPPIVFDVDDQKVKFPPTQRLFVIQSNTKAYDVASQFLQQYFIVFDTENRQPLLETYHEQAVFSLSTNISQNSNKFSQYLIENRNLCKFTDTNRRRKLLKQGKLPVVSFLTEIPRTKHDLNSFTMDVSVVTDAMMVVTVTGLFKELCSASKELSRYFSRTFVLVSGGAHPLINNDQLFISNATVKQEKQFGTSYETQPTPGPSTAPPPAPNTTTGQLTEEVKQQMIMSLSQQTTMNIEWSLKFLEEVQWNFDNACAAFQVAFSSGKIPADAFTR